MHFERNMRSKSPKKGTKSFMWRCRISIQRVFIPYAVCKALFILYKILFFYADVDAAADVCALVSFAYVSYISAFV